VSDWNTVGKIIVARKLMQHAEHHGLLPREHMGGRKGRKATDGTLKKRLLLDNFKTLPEINGSYLHRRGKLLRSDVPLIHFVCMHQIGASSTTNDSPAKATTGREAPHKNCIWRF